MVTFSIYQLIYPFKFAPEYVCAVSCLASLVDTKIGYNFQARYEHFLRREHQVETVTYVTYETGEDSESSGSGMGATSAFIVAVAVFGLLVVFALCRFARLCHGCSPGLKMANGVQSTIGTPLTTNS